MVESYRAQYDVQEVTIKKLRWLLAKATAVFGDRRIGELTSQEIDAWRMTLAPGRRFEATQALRQVLHRAVAWGMIDSNAAKVGVDKLEALAEAIGPRYGRMILFAAATGLRPAEWMALEKRDLDQAACLVYVRRSFTRRELKRPKTDASLRAVPGRSTLSNAYLLTTTRRCSFRATAAATSTSTTSGPSNGGRRSSPWESRRAAGSTISGTRLRPSLFVPESPPSTSPAT
ncbi:MAG: Phage integrase family [Gaiellaceae bacterium]|nr:Phage integrase family [Gaiellaceae bacterium]